MRKPKMFAVAISLTNASQLHVLVSAATKAQAARTAAVHVENNMPHLTICGVEAELVK